MRKNPVLENEMKRYTRNMKCAWIILGVNLVLALFALIAQMGLSGRENYMTILQYRFPIQCYVLMEYGLFLAICILIPGLAGGSIAGERERKTLDLLLTTHLSPWKIILGKLESSLCLIFLISFSTLPVIGLVLIYGGITLVNLFQLILNLVITGIFIGSIGIFYSAIMRKTTVAVILSYVTVVLLVLGTVGILFGIGYIQQMRGMYREDFTGIRLGGLVYLLYFNPAVTLWTDWTANNQRLRTGTAVWPFWRLQPFLWGGTYGRTVDFGTTGLFRSSPDRCRTAYSPDAEMKKPCEYMVIAYILFINCNCSVTSQLRAKMHLKSPSVKIL